MESKSTFFLISKLSCFFKWSILLSRKLSSYLQDIEKGFHNDEDCEEYCKRYKDRFGQKLPDCQFKGNKSKIQNLIRKVHVDANGSVNEIQFDITENNPSKNSTKKKESKNEEPTSLRSGIRSKKWKILSPSSE